MVHELLVVAFAMAVGFTASGIAANVYLLVFGKPEGALARTSHLLMMVVAGPNVILGKAASAKRERKWSTPVFWFVAAGTAYWSFVLGLFLLDLAIRFTA